MDACWTYKHRPQTRAGHCFQDEQLTPHFIKRLNLYDCFVQGIFVLKRKRVKRKKVTCVFSAFPCVGNEFCSRANLEFGCCEAEVWAEGAGDIILSSHSPLLLPNPLFLLIMPDICTRLASGCAGAGWPSHDTILGTNPLS
jgi:hypothetical protein